uniref:DUF4388 domain-containing protein n=1 Tax=Candidatus Desulfatibia profunda TaxID=2841695 RepID=A0A8J6TKY3_9BACT|nr:DUF4388 domain-containing protein [Candidatus Desulfatibia profunda]
MKLFKKPLKNRAETITGLFLENYPTNSRFAEAYRTLRTNIRFSFMEKEFCSLLVTSAGETEGKTSTVANLAYTISQAGRSVLMIDTDLRKSTLSQLNPSQNSAGLTGLLSDFFGAKIEQGSLEQYGIGDLFRLLALRKKTGLLRLSEAKETFELLFLQGELVDFNWLTRPEEKKLANLLVSNKLLSREQANSALVRQKDTGQKLGFVLTNMGLVKPDDLKGPLTIHMMESFRLALKLKAGKFFFKELSESDFELSTLDPVDFQQLYKQVVTGEEELPYIRKAIDSVIVKINKNNLFLLPSGKLPPNPSEILGSERMSFLISNLKKLFDVLILDSPPVLPASDALLLTPLTDGVVLIVKPGLMRRQLVTKCVEQLRLAKANMLGVVLNNVDVTRAGYYSYYHKYYSRYYGESKESKT